MQRTRDTRSDLSLASHATAERRSPGLVWIFCDGEPRLRAQPLDAAGAILGRDLLPDERISRQHAEVAWTGSEWRVRDLGSRNGTFVDGRRVEGSISGARFRLVRVGQGLGFFVADVRPCLDAAVERDGAAVGPVLARADAPVA